MNFFSFTRLSGLMKGRLFPMFLFNLSQLEFLLSIDTIPFDYFMKI